MPWIRISKEEDMKFHVIFFVLLNAGNLRLLLMFKVTVLVLEELFIISSRLLKFNSHI